METKMRETADLIGSDKVEGTTRTPALPIVKNVQPG
jgi:hypothetical protein